MAENQNVTPIKKETRILRDFSTLALVLIPITVGINFAGRFIVTLLQLPVYLDSIGTILAGIIAGPWVGAVVGLITNLVTGLTVDPSSIPYAIVNVAFGIAAGLMARAGWFEKWYKVIWAGLVIMAIGILVSAPITVYAYGGVPVENAGAALVWSYLRSLGVGLWQAVFAVSFPRELADKMIVAFVSYFIYKSLPPRFLLKFPGFYKNTVK